MKISIVINTLNRAQDLERALLSLRYLDYPDFEVIVVNGPSTDNTSKVLEQYKEDIKIGNCPVNNISVSRNIGIAMSSGKYVAFMDDDAIPEPNWLSNLIKGFSADDIAAVGSDVYNPTGKEYQIRKLICNRWGGTSSQAFDFPYSMQFTAVMGTNCIFDKEKLLEIGGYNEQYDYFLDETDVCVRLVDAGYRINYIPNACIHHKFSPSAQRNTSKVVTDWTKIIKNTVYFSRTYLSYLGDDVVTQHIKNIAKDRKDESLRAMRNYELTKNDYDKACASIDAGIKQGEKDFQRGYHLFITKDTLDKYNMNFKKFSTFKSVLKNNQKNIVYFSEDYPPYPIGGVGKFIYDLSNQVAKKGHFVHVITDSHNEIDTIDFENGVWVHRITKKQYPVTLLSDIPINSKFSYSKMNALYSYYEELLHINQKMGVDIVHSTIWGSIAYFAMLDSRFTNVMTLVTPFSNVFGKIQPRPDEYQFAIDLEEDTLNRCHIHADSKAIIHEVSSYYTINKDIFISYLGLQDISINIQAIPQKNINILFTGRLEYRKGIDILLESAAIICKKYENVVFQVCGRDDVLMPNSSITYKNNFLKKYQHENFIKRIIFEGYVDDNKLKQSYADCDIFVSPSRYESFGLIFLEAMMFSKPVVGCNAGAMPEVIQNGVTGLLAEAGDVDSLVTCLEKLICDSDLRQKLGRAGRQRYEKYFTSQKMAENILSYYDTVLENK